MKIELRRLWMGGRKNSHNSQCPKELGLIEEGEQPLQEIYRELSHFSFLGQRSINSFDLLRKTRTKLRYRLLLEYHYYSKESLDMYVQNSIFLRWQPTILRAVDDGGIIRNSNDNSEIENDSRIQKDSSTGARKLLVGTKGKIAIQNATR